MAAGPKNSLADVIDLSSWRGREQALPPVTVHLGDCECPGRPHEDGDWAEAKTRLLYGDVAAIKAVAENGEPGDGMIELLYRGVVRWNLTTRTGDGGATPYVDEPLVLERESFQALSGKQGQALSDHFSTVPLNVPLPNARGATSAPTPEDERTSPEAPTA
jgi:hypothetical protein